MDCFWRVRPDDEQGAGVLRRGGSRAAETYDLPDGLDKVSPRVEIDLEATLDLGGKHVAVVHDDSQVVKVIVSLELEGDDGRAARKSPARGCAPTSKKANRKPGGDGILEAPANLSAHTAQTARALLAIDLHSPFPLLTLPGDSDSWQV